MTDMKAKRDAHERVTCTRPQLSILPYNGKIYGTRGVCYGADKYARGNYFGPPPEGVTPVARFLGYLDAAARHLGKIAHAVNVALGTGGDAVAACAVVDDEASGGFPPSMLPHMAHAIAGLMIAVECGVHDGLLPADPGEPWKAHPMYQAVLARRGVASSDLPQKDDPDAEARRTPTEVTVRLGQALVGHQFMTDVVVLVPLHRQYDEEWKDWERMVLRPRMGANHWTYRYVHRDGRSVQGVPIQGGVAADLTPGPSDLT